MDHFGERIKKLLSIRKMSRTQFADSLGISVTRLNHYINGRYQPKTDLLATMVRVLDTTADYMLGRLDFYPSAKASQQLEKLHEGGVFDLSGSDNWLLTVNVYESLGDKGSPPVSSIHVLYDLYALYEGGYYLLMQDDSMAPLLKVNDLLGIECLRVDPLTISNEKLYILKEEGDNVGRVVRKAHIEANNIIFTALNSKYPPMVFDLTMNRYNIIYGHVNVLSRVYP